MSGTEQRITATVCDEVYESNGKYYYPLEVKKIRNSELSGFKILASSSVLYDVEVYDELDAKISLYQNADSVFGNYDISKGYFLRGAIKHYSGVVTEKAYEKPFYYNFILLRRNIKSVISEYLPQDCANLLTAVMLGDKHSFTTEEKEMFSSAGMSHLMSVSGFHVTIVAQLFMLILQCFSQKAYWCRSINPCITCIYGSYRIFSDSCQGRNNADNIFNWIDDIQKSRTI